MAESMIVCGIGFKIDGCDSVIEKNEISASDLARCKEE